MNSKILISLLGVAVLTSACSQSYLDIEQKGVVTVDQFYQTDDDAVSAMTNAYQSFALNVGGNAGIYVPYQCLFNVGADDMNNAGGMWNDHAHAAPINEYRYNTSNEVVKNTYWRLYGLIYDCNLVIDHFADANTAVKKRCVGEARVLRAWAHMMLAMGWDCPPLVDHVLDAAEKPTNYEGGHNGLLEWCAQECLAVVGDLEERQSPTDKAGASKVTRGFAQAVAGKALVFAGKYAEAKAPLKAVITSGKYQLVPTDRWAELFHITGDLDEEMILQIHREDNAGFGDWSNKIQRTEWMVINCWNWSAGELPSMPTGVMGGGWGGCAIREDFAKKFLANDGDSPRRKASFLTTDEFLYEQEWQSDRDAAANGTTLTMAQKKADPLRGIQGRGFYGSAGYFHKKLVPIPEDGEKGWYGFRNLTIMRLAEVYLLYAEACAQTNDGDGLTYLNAIQNRAGSAHVSGACTMDEVKNEKMFEMWLEECRFIDQVRWGDTQSLVDNGKHIPTTFDEFFVEGKPGYQREHKFYVVDNNDNGNVTAGTQVGFIKGKHEHFPYPLDAITVNPNLKQNPGWTNDEGDSAE